MGGIGHFGRIIGLLISAHQRLHRVLLDDAVGILRQESFQAADLGSGILLLHRADVGIVLGWILNLFFLRLGWCSRLSSRWCGSGLLCSGGLGGRRVRPWLWGRGFTDCKFRKSKHKQPRNRVHRKGPWKTLVKEER